MVQVDQHRHLLSIWNFSVATMRLWPKTAVISFIFGPVFFQQGSESFARFEWNPAISLCLPVSKMHSYVLPRPERYLFKYSMARSCHSRSSRRDTLQRSHRSPRTHFPQDDEPGQQS